MSSTNNNVNATSHPEKVIEKNTQEVKKKTDIDASFIQEILDSNIQGISTPEKKIGEIIYLKRCKLRWSQDELAAYANRFNICNLSQQRISYLEKGAKIYWLEICAISQALGVSTEEFKP